MAPPGDPKDPPPGLASERTRLAWSRTVIAFAAVGGALLKTSIAAGATVVGLAVLIWGLSRIFPAAAEDVAKPARLRLIALTVAGVSLVALAVAFLAHGA